MPGIFQDWHALTLGRNVDTSYRHNDRLDDDIANAKLRNMVERANLVGIVAASPPTQSLGARALHWWRAHTPLPRGERSKHARNEIRKHIAAFANGIGLALITVGSFTLLFSFALKYEQYFGFAFIPFHVYEKEYPTIFIIFFSYFFGMLFHVTGVTFLSRLED